MQEVQLEKNDGQSDHGDEDEVKLRFLKIVILSTKKKMKLRTWIQSLMDVTNRDLK